MEAERILDGLNQAQKAAVTSVAQVLQVLAPPGSGKTKTLTARAAYLIAHHGLNPRNIIVCTFTNKAAKEMGERVCAFLGKDVANKLILGTFHSIARRFLSAYGRLIGLDEKFGIADTSDTTSILTRLIKQLKFTANPAQTRSRISSLKSQNITAEQNAARSKKADQQEFSQLYLDYEDYLRVSNLLDFDDLLMRCAELLRRHPGCVANIEAILIDEFQDTNNVQYELMEMFAQRKETVTIVGDPDQSIYGWRNAEIKNLVKMQERYRDTHVIHLEENYRSSGAILLTAQEVIEQDESRPPKRLMPTHSVGMRPVLRRIPTAHDEAAWLVSEIKRSLVLTGGLLDYSDYAILLRTATLSRLFESALGKAGIPYRMVGGHRFYDRVEVKLILDYLRVIGHPYNNDAIARVINVPSRLIGDRTVQALLEEAESGKIPLWRVVLDTAQGNRKPKLDISPQAQKGIEMFVNIVLTAQKKLQCPQDDEESLASFLAYIVNKIGMEGYLKKKYPEEFESRWTNVQELVAQASDFCIEMESTDPIGDESASDSGEDNQIETQPRTISDALTLFLANVALATDNQEKKEEGERKAQVTLSTIHKAKGLEWPVVFIPAAYEGSIPHSRAEDNDEERRLLYVAMTRAQALLYLSCPMKNSQYEKTTLSSFLSRKPMETYFDKAGARLGFEIAKELATILRRPCPDPRAVEEALRTIESARDNQWPLSGEYTEEDRQEWEIGATIQPLDVVEGNKRRRVDAKQFRTRRQTAEVERKTPVPGYSAVTTMQNIKEHSITTAMLSNTFISASKLPIAQPQADASTAQGRKVSGLVSSMPLKRKGVGAAQKDGQGSLMSFFGKRHSAPVDTESSLTRCDPGSEDLYPVRTLQDISAKLNIPGFSSISDAATSKEGVITWQPSTTETELEDEPTSIQKPAAIFHTTSMTQIKSAVTSRKTLGVRRSMNGWAARMSQK